MKMFIIVVFFLFFSGCEKAIKDRTLRNAGSNRAELEKVLHHYNDDKLKYDAAVFLISNIGGRYSTVGERVDGFHHFIDSVYRIRQTEYDIPAIYNTFRNQKQNTYASIRRDNFTYPVCFEDDDYLNRLNRLPSDMTFQTLLLDKENKVVAIGSPVLNPKIKDLYLEIITGKKKEGTDKSVTTVSMDQSEKNFGNIPLNEKREHVFKLVNTGNKPLVVYDVVTSCGCTKAEYKKEPVRPGNTLEFKVVYNAEDKGRFRKNLTVYCNVEDSPLKLTVLGMVE